VSIKLASITLRVEEVLLKSRMRENLTSGSVRGLIATLELLLRHEVGYEFYLTKKHSP
jgi:hypothetical protein